MAGNQKNLIEITKNLLEGKTCRNCMQSSSNFTFVDQHQINATLISCKKDYALSDTCEKWIDNDIKNA